jgi:putative nucleotidyltransferase with HDIG domain
MPVHIIADSTEQVSSLRDAFAQQHGVTTELLSGATSRCRGYDAVVAAADLRAVENIAALKQVFRRLSHLPQRIFLVDQKSRLLTGQAHALGATHVLHSLRDVTDLLGEKAASASLISAPAPAANPTEDMANAGAAALGSMFSAVSSGNQVIVADARSVGNKIKDHIAEHGLSNWLAMVRRHHEGTFQHCLLVSGVAVDFGLSLALSRPDMERLTTAAMLHDVGKANVPLAVLDKPGRLDPEERAIVETHPAAGYRALKDNKEVSREILDAVLHHHEYLDGSGYPDGLTAANIPDLVRILTISDIFAALIERRAYREPMPREQAYEILKNMRGKLEAPLIAAFRDVALNR